MGTHKYEWLTQADLNKLMMAVKRKKMGFVDPIFDVEEVICPYEKHGELGRKWLRGERTLLQGGQSYYNVTLIYG